MYNCFQFHIYTAFNSIWCILMPKYISTIWTNWHNFNQRAYFSKYLSIGLITQVLITESLLYLPAVPSAPQTVISSVNETSVMLDWMPPRDSGGREDVVFNIICKSCGGGRGGCTRCGDNVQFLPRQLGLTESRVYISDLLAHTQYTFEVQAVNGVSDQSPYSPQYASVNITTNQAGKWAHLSFSTLYIPHVVSSSLLFTPSFFFPCLFLCCSYVSYALCSTSSSHSFLYKHIMHSA